MATRFSISGWRSSTIAPRYSPPSAAGSPVTPAAMPAQPESNVGPVNAAAQSPLTAAALAITPQTLNDSKLGSRLFGSTVPGKAQPFLAESVYQQPNVPAFLSQAVSDLNTEQALKRSLQSEWNNKILGLANSGSPDSYLYQEAVRAASVAPGAHVNFGAAIQSPDVAAGYKAASEGAGKLATAQAGAISAPQQLQSKISMLQREKEQLGQNAFGQYHNSRQQKIDQELFDLQSQLSGANTVAAGNNTRGWTAPKLPY